MGDSSHNQNTTVTQKAGNMNNLPSGSTGSLPNSDRKKNYRLNLPPIDRPSDRDMKDLLNQLQLPIILMGNFNAHNAL